MLPNIKKYDALYLVIAAFSLLSAHAQNPNWSLDTRSFQYSMNITGAYFANCEAEYGGFLGDSVAAFSGSEIRGVAATSAVINGRPVAFLSIFSNSPIGEEITFKWYRKTENDVINLDATVDFGEGVILGSQSAPFQFAEGEAYILPELVNVGNSLFVDTQHPNYASYQWYHDGEPMTDEVSPFLTLKKGGFYYVKVTIASGCVIESNQFEFVGETLLSISEESLSVYPNPASRKVFINIDSEKGPVELTILSMEGGPLRREVFEKKWNDSKVSMNVSDLPRGVYFIQIKQQGRMINKRFIKE